jgi:uncharacterized protein
MASTADVTRFELPLVLFLGAANVVSEFVPGSKAPLVLVGVAAWAALIVAHLRADRGAWRRWGFRRDNLRQAAVPAALAVFPLLAAFTLWGVRTGHFPPPRGFLSIVLVYPAWGIAQQFLLQAIVWSNLSSRMPRAAAQPLAAALFALSHAPDWPIMALTFPAGLLTTEHYRRWPNLWVLGTAHALLGTFAFYFLLGRDPLALLAH